jgi:hypothetical protein
MLQDYISLKLSVLNDYAKEGVPTVAFFATVQ